MSWANLVFDPLTSRMSLFGGLGLAVALILISRRLKDSRRNRKRFNCDLPTGILIDDSLIFARIKDISAKGAKLRADYQFQPGSRGTLVIEGYGWVEFTIIWSNERFAGIRLRDSLRVNPRNLAAGRPDTVSN